MIFQSIEEVQAQLLINPSTELDNYNLGANLYFLKPRLNDLNEPDCIICEKINYTYLKKQNCWVIELTKLSQLINMLEDGEFYFDHSIHTKTFTYTYLR